MSKGCETSKQATSIKEPTYHLSFFLLRFFSRKWVELVNYFRDAYNKQCKKTRIMWRSHQPRFHPDLNRGLYRERVGVVLSAPIRSYHVLMSILTIGLIVENFLAAKKFVPINTIASTIGTIASDRMTS